MPIYSVGNEGNKELYFGTGDIKVSSGWSKDDSTIGVLVLRQQEPNPIGNYVYNEKEEVNEGEAPVRMIFNKVESVDVLIERLETVKKYMTNGNKVFVVGDLVEVIDAMDVSFIGKEAEITEVVSQNPLCYKLDIGGGHWLHSQLARIE